jgi:hypothetical protein
MGPSIVGVPHLKHKDSFLGPPPFFFMSNEINLFQILYGHLKYLFFSLINVRIVKFIQCGNVLSMAQTSQNFHFLKFCTLQYDIWFLSHLNIWYTLAVKVFVVKILKQNNLFRHSLWVLELFFPHETKS